MLEANRRHQPASSETPWLLLIAAMAAVAILLGILWIGALPSVLAAGAPERSPGAVLRAVFSGDVPITAAQIVLTIVLLASVMAAGIVVTRAVLKLRRGRTRVDYKGRSMARTSDVAEMMVPEIVDDSRRLGADHAGPGVTLGKHTGSGRDLFASWEWVQIYLMGPRAGKTSCVCIPQILETAGPVVATSNKRDIVDLSRGPRSTKGVVWVHDVQDIIGEPPTWWWNPLSFVTDMETAEKLADIFITSETAAGASQDAYFTSAGRETLSRLLLAAALGGRPITDVFKWANSPDPDTTDDGADPADLLALNGEPAQAEALRKAQTLTEKQRDGVYGTIRPWVNVLGSRKVSAWIVDDGTGRPHFDPSAFVRSTDTIYLISKEGGGSARAITGALTMAILIAAERIGSTQRGGRLSTPLMAVLDEAANVCRWRELPDVYSHYGSRGIIMSTFFQSWAQGVEAFGEHGMAKLWSAANIRVAGRGLAEDKFLPFLSSLIGDHDVVKRTVSVQRGGRSTSTSIQREAIFSVGDLTAMPRGRAVMLASGIPATLISLVHFSQRPYAADVAASRDYYEGLAATDYLPQGSEA